MQFRIASICGLIVSMASVTAQAALYTYAPPAFVGPNVTYTSVSETSSTTSAPLYNAPTISGNNLLFRDLNFSANSIGGAPATSFVDGQLNVALQAKPGNALTSVTFSEFGDYNVSATPANPAAIDYTKVYPQALHITVVSIGGVALATPLVDNSSVVLTFSPSGGDYQTGVDPSTGSWSGLAVANLAALFGSNNITGITVSYDNQLLAQSQVGGIAIISKKGVDIDPVVRPTPEPAAASLLLIGATGISAARRRKRTA